MSERLRNMVTQALLKIGKNAKTRLAAEAGVSPSTLVNIIKHGHVPKPENVYALAKACGRSDEEASTIACECFQSGHGTA